MKLSIIIPIYNAENYLDRCLASIQKQSFSDYEILLIDDGSSDQSLSMCESWGSGDRRIKVLHQTNQGVSSARNKGLRMAQGEFVMFIDADDELAEGYLERIFQKVEKNAADLYVWGITKKWNSGKSLRTNPEMSGLFLKRDFLSAFPYDQYEKKTGLYGFVSNKLLKHSIIESNNLSFNQELKLLEDYDFFLDYYRHIACAYCFDESGYIYNINEGSASSRKNVDYISLIDIHRKCLRLLDMEGITKWNKSIGRDISSLVLAAFSEMNPVSLSKIRMLLKEFDMREEIRAYLEDYSTKYDWLRMQILSKNAIRIFIYLRIWRMYLSLKRKSVL